MSQSRVIQRLLELCSIPSVTGDEAAIVAHLEARAPGDWPLTRVGHSLIFGGPKGDKPLIALVGHTDTVPPHEGDPEPHIAGDRLYGLGCSDMKAGLAVMLELMEEGPRGCDLCFIFYDREEGPYVENGLEPVLQQVEWLREIDLALCLEPSDNRLQLGCLGTLHATITFEGRACHSARPWQGRNAIQAAGAFLAELDAQQVIDVHTGGLLYREVMSVTKASGGRARNVIPEAFELNLNYRFAPTRSLESAQAEVLKRVDGRAKVEFTDLCPSGPVFAENPYVQDLLARTGLEAAPKQAWTDVARLALYGIPSVNLGPGESAQAHQARESVAIELVEQGLELIRRYLDGVSGAA